MTSRALAHVAAFAVLATACHAGPDVARLSTGENIDGHFIGPDAYSAYLQGTLLEANGDVVGAAGAYERALGEDPVASELWARLGVVLCTRDRARADAALARSTGLSPELEAAWLARAECELMRGRAGPAVVAARRAASLAPDDPEASALVARALDASAEPLEAGRWRRGFELFRPGDFVGDSGATPPAPRVLALTALDRALAEGDADEVHRAATRARVSSTELAIRALAFGRVEFARDESNRILSAEPGNADGHAAALVAADLSRDEPAFERETARLPKARTPLGEAAARLMAELLRRRSGDAAAQAFSDATTCDPKSRGAATCASPPGSP